MPTLLHLDTSPLGEASISRVLSNQFVTGWKQANPDGKVITRDLTTTNIPPITGAYIAAVFTPDEALTPEQKQLTALSDTLIAELKAADEYVLGVAMHNFAIPATLKLWIDQVVRANKTFSYATGSPVGLLTGKKAHVFAASGGIYTPGTEAAAIDFVVPYLRVILGFIGVTDVTFHAAGGTTAVTYGKIDRAAYLEPHVENIRKHFAA